VSGDIIIWRDYRYVAPGELVRGIYGYDLVSETEFPICTHPAAKPHLPRISGDIVVWYDDRNSGTDIYGFDVSGATQQSDMVARQAALTTGNPGNFPICTHPARQWDPVVSGNTVLWLDDRNSSGGGFIPEPGGGVLLGVACFGWLAQRRRAV
ncbi:MAG: hypothetical protein ABIF82_10445, partial [Planctomycetota bacterium]